MSTVKFMLAARCEAAGRTSNEDNFQLTDNLAGDLWGFTTDQEVELGDKGALLVVCDGMGGMNAGEVASQLAVETIKEWFVPERLTEEVTKTSESIIRHIENAIIEADKVIKHESAKDKEKEGMGTTIVLAWIIGQSVYVGWCGDSRAYCFNAAGGLKLLSHDHSYVQGLVDAGQLSEDRAFNHPNNNIITRSLGDSYQIAIPEVKEYPLHDGDVILLCSDGLNGVLRDTEIEAVIRENAESMAACRDDLWETSREEGWNDNVTIGLCRIVSGCEQQTITPPEITTAQKTTPQKTKKPLWKSVAWFIAGLIAGVVACLLYEKFRNCFHFVKATTFSDF